MKNSCVRRSDIQRNSNPPPDGDTGSLLKLYRHCTKQSSLNHRHQDGEAFSLLCSFPCVANFSILSLCSCEHSKLLLPQREWAWNMVKEALIGWHKREEHAFVTQYGYFCDYISPFLFFFVNNIHVNIKVISYQKKAICDFRFSTMVNNCDILRCDTIQNYGWLQTFLRKLLPPSSG
jgi:hypothetical protein